MTGNALVSGIVAAIVAGVISFGIAHYQSQDAARQAQAAQVADGASQVESVAAGFYEAAESLYAARKQCIIQFRPGKVPPGCPASDIAFLNSQAALGTAFANTSDQQIHSLLSVFIRDALDALAELGTPQGSASYNKMTVGYYQLVTRCGQLIQGQQ